MVHPSRNGGHTGRSVGWRKVGCLLTSSKCLCGYRVEGSSKCFDRSLKAEYIDHSHADTISNEAQKPGSINAVLLLDTTPPLYTNNEQWVEPSEVWQNRVVYYCWQSMLDKDDTLDHKRRTDSHRRRHFAALLRRPLLGRR